MPRLCQTDGLSEDQTEILKAVRQLKAQAIDVNVTLIFQPLQALMAAKAGATFGSPFVGRIDAIGGDRGSRDEGSRAATRTSTTSVILSAAVSA